jgi:predicted aspartyl protease
LLLVHLGSIIWDNVEKIVPLLASGYKPLLGVAMMEDYHLGIDFADNGLVSLEKL